jgi:hypothetical protein
MCVLCWQFLTADHWTESHIGRDDSAMEKGDTATGDKREHIRRRDWRRRTAVLNHILGAYGLSVDDWQSRSYMLSDRKGGTLLVQNLGELWPAAEQLVGRCLDPLDPQLIDALQAAGHAPESTR